MQNEDVKFMSELEAAHNLKPLFAAQVFLWAIAGFFFWMLLWAAFSQVDERVRGMGQVMPSSDVQVIQSLEGGILSEIMVTEGALVKKDQPLLRIADVQFAAESRGIEAVMMGMQAKQERLRAEAYGRAFVMPAEIAKKYPDIAANEEKLYRSRQSELNTALNIVGDEVHEAEANLSEVRAAIDKYSRGKGLLEHQLDIARKLVAQKAMPEIEKLKLERELNDVAGSLNGAYQSKQSQEARLSAAKQKEEERRGAFRSQALGELNEVESKLAGTKENLTSAADRVSRTELKSPVEGIVQKLYLRTIGGVIQPAQKLVEIVPAADDLVIRAKISPADVAFLKIGQDVKIKVTAYDSQIYGTLNGKLERISANTVEDQKGNIFFEIDVRADKNYLGTEDKPLRIFSGMVAETEVITGKRTILAYLLKPVLRTKDRAFTEK
jgi:adhesin transport system membrane fusion protein